MNLWELEEILEMFWVSVFKMYFLYFCGFLEVGKEGQGVLVEFLDYIYFRFYILLILVFRFKFFQLKV